jgi:tetratricopeptide (TPR) repeat protein
MPKRAFQALFRFLISVFAIFFLLEVMVRIILPQKINPNLQAPAFGMSNALLAGTDFTWIDHRHYPTYNISINNKHLRSDREIPYDKSPGVFRILCLGDSVLFGSGVEFDELFSSQLERLLNQEQQSKKYEVINASAPAWGLLEYYIYLKNEGYKYSPDLVVIGLSPDDLRQNYSEKIQFRDIQSKTQIDGSLKVELDGMNVSILDDSLLNRFWQFISQARWYAFASQKSHLLNLVRHRLSGILVNKAKKVVEAEESLVSFLKSYNLSLKQKIFWDVGRGALKIGVNNQPILFFAEQLKEDREKAEANVILFHLLMQSFFNLVSDMGAKTLVIQLPSFTEVVGMSKPTNPEWIFPQTNQTQYLDFFEPFYNFNASQEVILFYPFDSHWSPGGHLLFAQLLTQLLKSSALIHKFYKFKFPKENWPAIDVQSVESANDRVRDELTENQILLFLKAMRDKTRGSLDSSGKTLAHYLQKNPDQYEVHFQLAIVLFELGRYEKSLEHLKTAQEGNYIETPKYRRTHYFVEHYWEGLKQLERKEYAKALVAFKQAETQRFYLERVYTAAGTASRKLGQIKEAEYYFKKVIGNRPKWLPYRLVLIMLYIETGNHDLALDQSREALELDRDNYKIYTLRGMAFWGMGEKEKALNMGEQALKLKPGDPFTTAQIKLWR